MSIPVEIHGGGSNNEDRYSKVPGVEERDGGYVGYVSLTADRPSGVHARTIYANKVQRSHGAALDDANWLVTQIDPDDYV